MTPRVRRALHEALDLVLDALAEDANARPAKRVRKARVRELPEGVADLTIERAAGALKKAGLL